MKIAEGWRLCKCIKHKNNFLYIWTYLCSVLDTFNILHLFGSVSFVYFFSWLLLMVFVSFVIFFNRLIFLGTLWECFEAWIKGWGLRLCWIEAFLSDRNCVSFCHVPGIQPFRTRTILNQILRLKFLGYEFELQTCVKTVLWLLSNC